LHGLSASPQALRSLRLPITSAQPLPSFFGKQLECKTPLLKRSMVRNFG
jgi:hypothetical protein